MTNAAINSNAAWARVSLGMARAEFNRLTPVEFLAIWEWWKLTQKRQDQWSAKLCHVVATSAGSTLPGGDPLPHNFFMPGFKLPSRAKKDRKFDAIAALLAVVPPSSVIDQRKKPHGQPKHR